MYFDKVALTLKFNLMLLVKDRSVNSDVACPLKLPLASRLIDCPSLWLQCYIVDAQYGLNSKEKNIVSLLLPVGIV